jgi:hypothetical protein
MHATNRMHHSCWSIIISLFVMCYIIICTSSRIERAQQRAMRILTSMLKHCGEATHTTREKESEQNRIEHCRRERGTQSLFANSGDVTYRFFVSCSSRARRSISYLNSVDSAWYMLSSDAIDCDGIVCVCVCVCVCVYVCVCARAHVRV